MHELRLVPGLRSAPHRRHLWLSFIGALGLCVLPVSAVVAQEDVNQFQEEMPTEMFQEDVTSLSLSAGGNLNTGNTQSYQLTGGGDFTLIRGRSGFTANIQGAYGRTNLPDDDTEDFQDTVKNLRARARYDFFITQMDAVFAAAVLRQDKFAGLAPRIQGQLGYLRYFLKQENHRFWGELGYDVTYDNYFFDYLSLDQIPDEDSQVVHSVRAFLGYDNQLNDAVTFLTGLESLFNVEDAEDVRLNWDSALRSSLGGDFQLEAKFTLNWDNVPVPGATNLDTITTITLIYTLL